ncbi:hypothetical protein FRB93_005447 [Tulasnella sp. JGI-2019a]|nr:hypothetical protein FRB93_005447 [Tulasnella sp. JGI-2019a]
MVRHFPLFTLLLCTTPTRHILQPTSQTLGRLVTIRSINRDTHPAQGRFFCSSNQEMQEISNHQHPNPITFTNLKMPPKKKAAKSLIPDDYTFLKRKLFLS